MLPRILLALYIGFGVAVVASPGPVDAPFSTQISDALTWAHAGVLPSWFGYPQLEATANIMFFIPVGFLLAASLPPRLWWVAPAGGAAASMTAELGQLLFLHNRFPSLQDVAMNASGAIIGTVLMVTIRAFWGWSARQAQPMFAA